MFALETVTVCCSIASCMVLLSCSFIFSISSIQTVPLLAKTMAPASRDQPRRNSSLTTAAVSPAAVAAFPETYLPLGATVEMNLSMTDLATPGSPTRRM